MNNASVWTRYVLPILSPIAAVTVFYLVQHADMSNRLGKLKGRLDEMSNRIGDLNQSLAKRMDDTNKRFDGVDRRLEKIEDRLSNTDTKKDDDAGSIWPPGHDRRMLNHCLPLCRATRADVPCVRNCSVDYNTCGTMHRPDPVDAAFRACVSEIKPKN